MTQISASCLEAASCSESSSDAHLILRLRANTSICPRLSAAIFVCAEHVVKMGVFCIMANLMLYIGTHSIGTCASLLHIIIIRPLLKIFNECRSLTGVGELNPYSRSPRMQKFNGGGRIKPLLKIFNECRSLTGVGELNPY